MMQVEYPGDTTLKTQLSHPVCLFAPTLTFYEWGICDWIQWNKFVARVEFEI